MIMSGVMIFESSVVVFESSVAIFESVVAIIMSVVINATVFWENNIHHHFRIPHEERIRMICWNIYFISYHRQKKVWEWIIFLPRVFVTNVIPRRRNRTTTLMNFCGIKFFNRCAAPASVRVHRFGCGFLHWFTFFTKQVPDTAFNLIRHTLSGELTTKLKNIWWSIKIFFERIFLRFFQRLTMRVSSLRWWMIIMTGFKSFGYIFSW